MSDRLALTLQEVARRLSVDGRLPIVRLDTLEAMGVLTTPWVCRIPPSGAFVMNFPSSISSYDIGPGRRVRRDGVAMWPERARGMSASEIEAEVDAALNRPSAPTAAAPKKPDAQRTGGIAWNLTCRAEQAHKKVGV